MPCRQGSSAHATLVPHELSRIGHQLASRRCRLRDRLKPLKFGELLTALKTIRVHSAGLRPPDWPRDPVAMEQAVATAREAARARLPAVTERRDEAIGYLLGVMAATLAVIGDKGRWSLTHGGTRSDACRLRPLRRAVVLYPLTGRDMGSRPCASGLRARR